MTVRELLGRIDSFELAEWRAFEKALGPIGPEYGQATLAGIHEQLQKICWVVGAQYEENPAQQPKNWPRPNEMFVARDAIEQQQEEVAGADDLNAFFDS